MQQFIDIIRTDLVDALVINARCYSDVKATALLLSAHRLQCVGERSLGRHAESATGFGQPSNSDGNVYSTILNRQAYNFVISWFYLHFKVLFYFLMLISVYICSFCCVLLCCLVRNKLIDWLIDNSIIFSRSYCYTIWSAISIILSSVCL